MSDPILRALIVDDLNQHTADLKVLVEKQQEFRCDVAADVTTVKDRLLEHSYSIVFLGLDCVGESGLRLIEQGLLDDVDEVILTNTVDDPVRVGRGIAAGATCFLSQPIDPHFVTQVMVDLASEIRADAGRRQTPETNPLDQFGLLRGSSPRMKKLFRTLRKVARTDARILIVGETGTGKELVARTVHQMGDRSDRVFLAVNCGAIASELFESELFGHEKGAFTGASSLHRGVFERADGGTLFLDEITEMPPDLQVKLLRVLEAGKFRRVGGEEDLSSNLRIISACNRIPAEAIEDGRFREDLYYRVASFPITLPPLRDRGDDIVGLAQFFLNQLNTQHRTSKTLSVDAIDLMKGYQWPGNIRELIGAVERAYVMSNNIIEGRHLDGLASSAASASSVGEDGYLRIALGGTIGDAERELIFATLDANGGDKQLAAESLGVSLKTLYNRLNEYKNESS